MKKVFAVVILLSLSIVFFVGYKTGIIVGMKEEKRINSMYENYTNELHKKQRENYKYPLDADEEHAGISVKYTESVLQKKSNGEDLSKEEDELIYEFILQGKYGFARTNFIEFEGGMSKHSIRWLESADGGDTWYVLYEKIDEANGQYSYTFIDNVLIESFLSEVTYNECDGEFKISYDRGHSFEKTIAFKDVFDYDGLIYPIKKEQSLESKTVTFAWYDCATDEKIAEVEYNLDLVPVKNN